MDGSPLPASVRAKDNVLYVDEVDERVNRSFLCEVTNALGSRASRQDVLVRGKCHDANYCMCDQYAVPV